MSTVRVATGELRGTSGARARVSARTGVVVGVEDRERIEEGDRRQYDVILIYVPKISSSRIRPTYASPNIVQFIREFSVTILN